jgi:hypothetical protein
MGIFDSIRKVVRPIGTVYKGIKKVIAIPEEAAKAAAEVTQKAVEVGKKAVDSLPDEIKEPLNELLSKAKEEVQNGVDRALDELPPELRGPAAGLLSQFWDLAIGNIKINDKLVFFDAIDRELAKFANAAYKDSAPKAIGTYEYDEEISSSGKYLIYIDTKNKIVINAIRGTKATDIKDLISDVAIVTGRETSDPQFKSAFDKWKQVAEKYPLNEYKHRMTGHSLGGGIVYFLCMTQPNFPNDRVCCFAPGVGASGKYRDFLRECQNGSARCGNLHTYKFMGDPVCLLAALGKVNITKAKSLINPVANHTMSNWT